jgi:predicted amidophosphoribosyltransferase
MNTEQHAWTSIHAVTATVRAESPSVCGCGQDLDVCAGTCCPRCGTSLTGHAA